MNLIGNGPTCDVYVTLGRYVCTNCGYEKPVERLPHDRPTPVVYTDWCGVSHLIFQCNRCGGGGSNSGGGNHIFNYNGHNGITLDELRNYANPHSLSLKCTICGITPNWSNHTCYANVCYQCGQRLAGSARITPGANTIDENGYVKLDLVTKTVDYYYWDVVDDISGNPHTSGNVHASSLYGGNYKIVSNDMIGKEGNVWHYRTGVSLIDTSKPITEPLALYTYGLFNSWRTNDLIPSVWVDSTPPTISNVLCSPQSSVNGWTTINQIIVSGTESLSSVVYVSMYDIDNNVIFENQACEVTGGNYNFSITPEIEANVDKKFIVKVKDLCGNISTKEVTLSKIDSKPPELAEGQQTEFLGSDDEWVRYHQILINAVDGGAGEIKFGFNSNKNSVLYQEKNDETYSYRYRCYGDVYGDDVKGLVVYLEDGVGNNAVYGFKFGHVDATEPTITGVEKIGDGRYKVLANDYNEKLNKEGSGVVRYAYSRYEDWYNNIQYQDSSEFNITKRGTYYAFAQDKAGNFSGGFKFFVE